MKFKPVPFQRVSRLLVITTCTILMTATLKSQNLLGYTLNGDTTQFIFDQKAYDIKNVKKVSVTGSFRNWDQDMDAPEWLLKKDKNGIWKLKVDNALYKAIPPRSEFKFRVNNGDWMAPPSGALNAANGNLIFMHDTILPEVKADMMANATIWVQVMGKDRPLDAEQYILTDANGVRIPIAEILPNNTDDALIKTVNPIDRKRVYFLEIPAYKIKTVVSFDGWFRTLYSHKELGANLSEDNKKTTFRIFGPRAEAIKLYLYKTPHQVKADEIYEMEADEDMVWESVIDKDLTGIFYDFTVHGSKDPGNHFYEVLPKHISDPYARVNMESWGKSMVAQKTTPATPLKKGIPAMEDVIAYEVHVQDFTDLLPVNKKLRGRLKSMFKKGLTNKSGEPIGIDYLENLGINTLHLMPVQEFMHHPDDIWKESFKDDPYMQEQGIAEENYQWGYRTSHAFAIENKFRDPDTKPGAEREQFRDLVQAYHDLGIAVIIDIVPNHTAEDMDGNWFFHWNVLDKIYYYRTKNLEHIGEYGNEVKTENRPMVQKWLIDQCKHFIDEFGIDGFRIDLAGQIDKQTLIKLKRAIGHDKILYGEPWIASNDPAYESNPSWDWYKADSPITFFQDDSRNAFKGPVFDLVNPATDRGYPGGKSDERMNVMKGLSNTFIDDKTTTSGINYLDIHDNWALADQFAVSDWDGRKGVEEEMYKIAATLLFTSMGPIVLHGGSEFMRSKSHAPLREIEKTMTNDVTMFWHGKRDTYNHRTANQFRWDLISKNASTTNPRNHEKMVKFWRGLIAMRNSKLGQVFRKDMTTPEDYYTFITPHDENLLGYIVDKKLLVLINVGNTKQQFIDVSLPDGTWTLIGNNDEINIKGIKSIPPIKVNNNKNINLNIPKQGILIYAKKG